MALFVFACVVGEVTPCEAEPPPTASRIQGRVFERGSAVAIEGAALETRDGASAITNHEGFFSIDVKPGDVELAITAAGYEPLRVTEKMPPNTARTVEYRLMPEFQGRYRSVVRGQQAHHEGERFTLRDEELQHAPGAVGDPIRVVATLPGVIAPIPVLPIYVIRGGSPGMNGFFLDGMRVPELFHLVFVDGVVHPRILDHIDFYPGSYDVTFGRIASGVIDASTRPGRTDAPGHGELELRIFDASALAEARLPGGISVLAAGRYGYPSGIIDLVQPGVNLSYWDYQFRFDWKGLTVEALGAYDSLSIDLVQAGGGQPMPGDPAAQTVIEFHRLQLRERAQIGRMELEAAIVGGLDRLSVFSGQGVEKLGLSARAHARWKLGIFDLSAGLDGEVSRFRGENFVTSQTQAAPDALGELAGDRDGFVGGGYLQAQLHLDHFLGRPASITAGLRADVYDSGPVTLLGIDPRLLFRVQAQPWLEFFGGIGQYTQAPSFPVPLPGIDTFALQLGLQRAWQGSVGMRFKLPAGLQATATGYYGRFDNINDVVLDFASTACTSAPPESVTGLAAYVTRQLTGAGYGMELLVRRQTGRVTGWLAYTLSRSERTYSCGLAPSDFDQAHVLNVVVQVRLPWRMIAGARLNVATGRPYTQLTADLASQTFTGNRNNARFPTYVQLDLRIDREWIFNRWALAVFLEALNVTYSETIFGVSYPKDPTLMVTRYDQPQFDGFRWVLPSIGVRGRF
jgi:hypothetical protein